MRELLANDPGVQRFIGKRKKENERRREIILQAKPRTDKCAHRAQDLRKARLRYEEIRTELDALQNKKHPSENTNQERILSSRVQSALEAIEDCEIKLKMCRDYAFRQKMRGSPWDELYWRYRRR